MAYGFRHIVEPTTENYFWLLRFREGDPAALRYIYPHVFKSLVNYGKRILDDEFMVQTFAQEAILKGWEHRERMETMFHIYRFMRLTVSWKCLACYRSRRFLFQRRLVRGDDLEYCIGPSVYERMERDEETAHFDEERVEQVFKVIPYLPPRRQTVFILHFRYGLSYKRIARRFATSHQSVHVEVEKGLEQLKTMLRLKKQAAVVNAIPEPEERESEGVPNRYVEVMPPEMWRIFRYRYEHKMGFDQIARKMNLTVPYIQQQYLEAHRRLRTLKTTRT